MRLKMRAGVATVTLAGLLMVVGCEPQIAGGGYHSTSSEQNVGSRSSNGTYGGTSDTTGRSGGTTGAKSAPATPYSSTAPTGTPGAAGTDKGTVVIPSSPSN